MSTRTIDWNTTRHRQAWGTSLRGYYRSPWSFEETVARLVTASGQPVNSDDGYKTSVNFKGTFGGRVFTLYDYKEDREIHIGGMDGLDVFELGVELNHVLSQVEPTAYTAKEHYAEKKGHGWKPTPPALVERVAVLPTLVQICAWCPDARELTRAVHNAGRTTTHTICPACMAKLRDE
jgi:hypothetical protein